VVIADARTDIFGQRCKWTLASRAKATRDAKIAPGVFQTLVDLPCFIL
jgi:hypothetical protein